MRTFPLSFDRNHLRLYDKATNWARLGCFLEWEKGRLELKGNDEKIDKEAGHLCWGCGIFKFE